MWFKNILSQFVVCIFILFTGGSKHYELWCNALFFSFRNCGLTVKSENYLPILGPEDFSPNFLSKSFLILCFTFTFMNHLELFFCKVWDLGKIHFAVMDVQAPMAFTEKAIIPPLMGCYPSFVKKLVIFVWVYFWNLYSVPIDTLSYVSIPSSGPHYL